MTTRLCTALGSVNSGLRQKWAGSAAHVLESRTELAYNKVVMSLEVVETAKKDRKQYASYRRYGKRKADADDDDDDNDKFELIWVKPGHGPLHLQPLPQWINSNPSSSPSSSSILFLPLGI